MYCSACEYDLNGLKAGNCPECGRAFEPADPDSFLVTASRARRKRYYAVAGALAVMLGIVGWYAIRSDAPIQLFMVVIAGIPGLIAFVAGARLRRTTPSVGLCLLAVAPAAALIILYQSLALHMYQSLGGWPQSIGNAGFSQALNTHADIALTWFGIMLLVNLFVLPIAVVVFAAIRPLRGALIYVGVYAIASALAIGSMLLANGQFQSWWVD